MCASEFGLLIATQSGKEGQVRRWERDKTEGSKARGAERLWGDRVGGENALTTPLSSCVRWAQPQAWGP